MSWEGFSLFLLLISLVEGPALLLFPCVGREF